MEPVRYAMIGMGGFGGQRRKELRESGSFVCLGGVEIRDEAFTQACAEEGRQLERWDSVAAVAADPRVELVVICTPAKLHVEQALIAAQAGKAIFTEKPLGHERAATTHLVQYCLEHGVPHGHGFSARFSPLWQHVKTLVDSGVLGRIVSISAATMHTGGLAFGKDNWRFTRAENPGGPLFQCGIHKIDLLRFLFGDGAWAAGLVDRSITSTDTDDAYVLMGRFGGIPTTFHSHYVASYRHAMEIYGTTGSLYIEEYPTRLQLKQTDAAQGIETRRDITAEIPASCAHLEALRDCAVAVRERRQPLMDGREGLRAMEYVWSAERIAQSAIQSSLSSQA